MCTLLKTNDAQEYMHEGFDKNNASWYNRDLFGWANALFAQWLMSSPAFPLGNRSATIDSSFCPGIPLPPPPSPPHPTWCTAELETLCGKAKGQGLGPCLLCTALHQAALGSKGCTQGDEDSFCQDGQE